MALKIYKKKIVRALTTKALDELDVVFRTYEIQLGNEFSGVEIDSIQIFIRFQYAENSGRGYNVRIDIWIELENARGISKQKLLKIIVLICSAIITTPEEAVESAAWW